MLKFFSFLIIILGVGAHVRLREPPNRSSIWRDERFSSFNPRPNYDDDAFYCGRVHQPLVPTNCGICGDPFNQTMPRDNENGGTYGVGIIAGNYTSGQTIEVSAEFTIAHKGYWQMHICDEIPESEACFTKFGPLKIGPNDETEYLIPQEVPIWANTTVQLPPGLTCTQCTLRLHYRAGNNWGECEDGSEGLGCGLQETFRSCADISIS